MAIEDEFAVPTPCGSTKDDRRIVSAGSPVWLEKE
jgi:hypothetical protein